MFKYNKIQFESSMKQSLHYNGTILGLSLISNFSFSSVIQISVKSLADTRQYSFFVTDSPFLLVAILIQVSCQCAVLPGQFASLLVLN